MISALHTIGYYAGNMTKKNEMSRVLGTYRGSEMSRVLGTYRGVR
jgi:hypothetical protein